MKRDIFFFIGTEAELIKLFPIMLNLKAREFPYYIIASGQNDIKTSEMMSVLGGKQVDLELSDESNIKKTTFGLLAWYIRTGYGQIKRFQEIFSKTDIKNSIMVVHGDTISTLMGAKMAAKMGMKIAHVEAGLRSYNWLHPFPEEIDRVIVSRKANYHFAPGEIPCKNMEYASGSIINTVYNTIVDSLMYSYAVPCQNKQIEDLAHQDYFVFILHRQENLANKSLVKSLIERIFQQAKMLRCAMILHKPTEAALQRMGLLAQILDNSNIVTLPRVPYFDFMKLLEKAQFVITDGGSNQEELSYMGKPCLVLRKHTERQDGVGENVVLYKGSVDSIDNFTENYSQHCRNPIIPQFSPSERIADTLCSIIMNG